MHEYQIHSEIRGEVACTISGNMREFRQLLSLEYIFGNSIFFWIVSDGHN